MNNSNFFLILLTAGFILVGNILSANVCLNDTTSLKTLNQYFAKIDQELSFSYLLEDGNRSFFDKSSWGEEIQYDDLEDLKSQMIRFMENRKFYYGSNYPSDACISNGVENFVDIFLPRIYKYHKVQFAKNNGTIEFSINTQRDNCYVSGFVVPSNNFSKFFISDLKILFTDGKKTTTRYQFHF